MRYFTTPISLDLRRLNGARISTCGSKSIILKSTSGLIKELNNQDTVRKNEKEPANNPPAGIPNTCEEEMMQMQSGGAYDWKFEAKYEVSTFS